MLSIEEITLLRELLTIKITKLKVNGIEDEKLNKYEELAVKLTKMMKQVEGNK